MARQKPRGPALSERWLSTGMSHSAFLLASLGAACRRDRDGLGQQEDLDVSQWTQAEMLNQVSKRKKEKDSGILKSVSE